MDALMVVVENKTRINSVRISEATAKFVLDSYINAAKQNNRPYTLTHTPNYLAYTFDYYGIKATIALHSTEGFTLL